MTKKTKPVSMSDRIKQTPETDMVFVFGSNLAGRHGKGAALYAKLVHGAAYGKGRGFHGNSYAIPTKDRNIQTLPLEAIEAYVKEFLEFAHSNSEMIFKVTAIGTGLAGYKHKDIAPMFKGAPENCVMPEEWKSYLAKRESK